MGKITFFSANANGIPPFAYDFLAILFILFTPYAVFMENWNFLYEYLNLFFFLCFAIIAAALSILLQLAPSVLLKVLILTISLLHFIDIQFDDIQWWGKKNGATAGALFVILWFLRTHVSQILAVVFGTMIVATLCISPLSHSSQNYYTPRPSSESQRSRLPLYVHVILDGQIGIEGFDINTPSHNLIKGEIEAFFTENKFRILSRAYAPYIDTIDTISSVLNLGATEKLESLYSKEKSGYVLLKNPYFEKILEMGYDINVYQSTYMDFCSSFGERIQRCLTYKHHEISTAALTGLTEYEKARIVLEFFGSGSLLFIKTKKFYNNMRGYLEEFDLILPEWVDGSMDVGPIPVLPVFDTLIKDVSDARNGEMFFAHLLIPHAAYSVDTSCEIRRPLLAWNDRLINANDLDQSNSPRSRLVRYEEYIAQVRCALLKLEGLLDSVKSAQNFDDATIIVHGDHGSRIVLVEPKIENIDRLSLQDFYDAYSTLYAVKSPRIDPGYDTRMMALPELLQNTVSGDIDASTKSEPDKRPTVFLRDREKLRVQEVPMPYLPITNR